MSKLTPDRIINWFRRNEAAPQPTSTNALLKLQNISGQLEKLRAKPFIDEQPDIIEPSGKIIQHKRKFVCIGGYPASVESDLVKLLQPIFPDLECLVSIQHDKTVHTIEVYCGEK